MHIARLLKYPVVLGGGEGSAQSPWMKTPWMRTHPCMQTPPPLVMWPVMHARKPTSSSPHPTHGQKEWQTPLRAVKSDARLNQFFVTLRTQLTHVFTDKM